MLLIALILSIPFISLMIFDVSLDTNSIQFLLFAILYLTSVAESLSLLIISGWIISIPLSLNNMVVNRSFVNTISYLGTIESTLCVHSLCIPMSGTGMRTIFCNASLLISLQIVSLMNSILSPAVKGFLASKLLSALPIAIISKSSLLRQYFIEFKCPLCNG